MTTPPTPTSPPADNTPAPAPDGVRVTGTNAAVKPTPPPDPFSEALQNVNTHKAQLDTLMAQVFRTLGAQRVQLPPEVQTGLNTSLTTMQKELRNLTKNSRAITKQLSNMQGLVKTSALITSSLDLTEVLNQVMDTIIMLTGAERAYLMLKESSSDELTIKVARNWDQESLNERDVVFSRGVIDEAFAQRKPIVTLDAKEDERFQNRQSVASNQLRSILCIPLLLQDEIIGALYTDNKAQMGLFDDDTVPMMTAFANQAAIAIVNARRFQTVQTDLAAAQREVQRLRIQIDQKKVDEEVAQIAESDYFQRLEARVDEMRNQFQNPKPDKS
jgi:transcriptional regulator with GAF, ATPase, and Fis domain